MEIKIQIVSRYGVLYDLYRPEFVWYQGYQMTRRLLVLAVLYPLAVNDLVVQPQVAPVALWLLCIIFLSVHLLVRAYREASLVWYESVSLLGLVLIATVFSTSLGPSFHAAAAGSILAVTCAILLLPLAAKYVSAVRQYLLVQKTRKRCVREK